jgi:hypothetical protein
MNIVGSCHCGLASNSNWNRNKNCGNLQWFALVKKNNNGRRLCTRKITTEEGYVQLVGAKVTQEFIGKENERKKEKERNLLRFRRSVANSHIQDLCLRPVVLQILNCGSVWNQTQISSTPSFPKQIRYNLYVCTICLSTHAHLDQYYFRTTKFWRPPNNILFIFRLDLTRLFFVN